MHSIEFTPDQYIDQLPEERKEVFSSLRQVLKDHLPAGFEETMSYGMIGYVVPHSLFPDGYHCDPKQPLPFISIASQKNAISLYHTGIYADQALLDWFVQEYPKHCKTKLDMGKSCIRFKKMDDIPFDLIAELAGKMTPNAWIEQYQAVLKNKDKPNPNFKKLLIQFSKLLFHPFFKIYFICKK